jgi:L-threonylcarbamoyladenylate synthase
MVPAKSRALDQDLDDQIEIGVELLRRGGMIAFPTDTLYGLGADAFNESAVERVFEAKGRPHGMPLPLLLPDGDWLSMIASHVSPLALRLAERFWPGPLTLVLPAGPRVPPLVTARGWTVAARVPAHAVPRELARRLGSPIIGTSANRSGGPDPQSPEEVRLSLGETIDLIIQGGDAPTGQASTVIDITAPVPRLLRAGALPISAIQELCGTIVHGPSQQDTQPPSGGAG